MSDDRSRAGAEQGPQLQVVSAQTSTAFSRWSGLADAGNEAKFCSAWLSMQCTRMPGVVAGLLMMPPPAKGVSVVSTSWPERNPYLRELMRVAEHASAERRTVASPGRSGSDASARPPVGLLVAAPLGAGSEPLAIAALALSGSSAVLDPERVAEQLRWGSGWLEALPWARKSQDLTYGVARAISSLDVVAVVGAQPRLHGTTIALVNDLATRLRCDRVSVGLLRPNGSVRLRAISHSASFKGQAPLVDAIENAMEEALDQHSSVAHPSLHSCERAVNMAHRALADAVRVPGASVMSVVLVDGNAQAIGAITFERHRVALGPKDLELAEVMAVLLGPVLGLQLRTNRLLSGRFVDVIEDGISALLGPRRPAFKLAAIAAALAALFLAFGDARHRVTGKSILEAETLRAAVAPFDGFIRTAAMRAGDIVKAGDVLATLDDRDLVLDRLKWIAERDKLLQKRREALAKHNLSSLVILDQQVRQVESQLALAEEKLSRASIVAPFDGFVVSGDLSQLIGSPVEKGKTLFEVAPLDVYRLVIHVAERDVRYISEQQRGVVAFAGMPRDPLPLTLTKITPVTVAEDGRNSYRVEARLTEAGPHLRPGLEGITKIDVGQRSILWVWFHSLVEWLQLAAWKYLP